MMQVDDVVYYDMMIKYTHARWRYYINLVERTNRYGSPLQSLEYDAYNTFAKASFDKLIYKEEQWIKRLKDAGLT